LTARRLYEHRLKHGPFRNREQFKEVTGFGEATFVQAAGFLKIVTSNLFKPMYLIYNVYLVVKVLT